MPITPANPISTTPTSYSAPRQTAGGGQYFVASGPCSGTVLEHIQDLTIFYEIISTPVLTGAWPLSTTNVSSMQVTVYGNAEDKTAFFSTSSVSGASGCAAAAYARQAHVMALSASVGSAGMGTAGTIYTLSGGYERNWVQGGQVSQVDNRTYFKGVVPIEGLPSGWNSNDILSSQVIRSLVALLCNGGLEYSNTSSRPPDVATAWPLMNYNLVEYV